MSQASVNILKLRLFIEGVECPVVSVQIQCAPNGPAQATIQIPPSPLGEGILPRTIVHVFFMDLYEEKAPHISMRGRDAGRTKTKDPTTYEQNITRAEVDDVALPEDLARDAHNVRYKLVFMGEVVGVQFVQSATNYALVLQCADLSIYWDTAYQFSNTDLFGPGQKALFSGGGTNLLTDFLSSPGEIVTSLLHQKSANFPALPGFLGGVVRMMEAIGGSYYSDNRFAGQNIFHSLAELRLRITQQLSVLPTDATSSRLLGVGTYDGLFGRTLGNLGDQVSIRKVLTALAGVIFHETYPITTPKYTPGSDGNVAGQERKKLSGIPEAAPLYTAAANGKRALEQLKTAITAPLEGNTALPEGGNAKANKDALLQRITKLQSTLRVNVNIAKRKKFDAASALFSQAATSLAQALRTLRTSWMPSAVPSPKALKAVERINDTIRALDELLRLDVNVTPKNKQVPARLHTQIIKPDIWFGPPPRCNVIFPDRYDQKTYSRQFLAEPTRLLLKLHNEFFGEDELFGSFYFAPRVRTVKGQKKTLQALFEGDIFPHELFTGILPVFEKMGEMNIFAVRSGNVDGKTPQIGLAQRSANFIYFKHRFAARQMPVSGPFNPYLACGFPALLLGRYVDPATLSAHQAKLLREGKSSPATRELLGTHYLGMIAELSHELSQNSARTSFRLAFAREYNEVTQFFGPSITEDQTILKRYGNDVVRTSKVAALSKPKVGSVGPYFGVISSVADITEDIATTDVRAATKLPLWEGVKRGTGEYRMEVPVGPTFRAKDLGTEVVEMVGGENASVTFRGYLIEEKVPNYRKEVVDLPAEELIRPGWYADTWHPANIGEAYRYFLGTDSITDPTQVADPDGMPGIGEQVGNLDNEEVDGLAAVMNSRGGDDPKFSSAVALLALEKNSSTEAAVEFLVALYSYAKQADVSIDELIRAYTWRPIATMVDIFGSHDLEYDAEGHNVIQGVEGFHSKAFGPYQDLFGLVPPEITEILGISRVSQARAMGDVRGTRREQVQKMIASILELRAILG